MVSWIVGTLIGLSLLGFIYLIVKVSKDFAEEQKAGLHGGKKKEKYKGGIQ